MTMSDEFQIIWRCYVISTRYLLIYFSYSYFMKFSKLFLYLTQLELISTRFMNTVMQIADWALLRLCHVDKMASSWFIFMHFAKLYFALMTYDCPSRFDKVSFSYLPLALASFTFSTTLYF